MIVFFDMDGTIADYEENFCSRFGEDTLKVFQETEDDEYKNNIKKSMAEYGFYLQLKVLPMFHRMESLFRNGVDVGILTSVGKVESYKVIAQKKAWLKNHCSSALYEHLMNNRFKTVLTSKDKAKYVNYTGKHTTLVDDREKAWRPFLEAGGTVVIV